MAIKIGHASSDERGKAHGGQAGDQTGGEVCIRSWYSSPWNIVLRCKDPVKAERMATACEAACANNRIGYDQYKRNTLSEKAKEVDWDLGKISEGCSCDCSSLMAVCAQAAGIGIPYVSGNAPYTGNMVTLFQKTGEFEVLRDSRYLASDAWLLRGDILIRESGHTAMALGNGDKVVPEDTGDNPSEWAREATEFCKKRGIFNGDGKGNYDWQKPITREAVAQIIFNILGK